ncbi:MAG: IS3 family transposase [Vicinamibacterales bacterium]|nr:IS3 family transposase [Vicinamibacterales bacterium]
MKPVTQREVVQYLTDRYTVSERRACRTARFCRSSLRHRSTRDPLLALRQRMREVAHARIRYGYRRLLVVLHREGWDIGKHRFYRVYCEEGLALRRKRPWRHATAVHREQRRPPSTRNDIWSMDFVADELTDGRRFRALTVIDLFTRECLLAAVGIFGVVTRSLAQRSRELAIRMALGADPGGLRSLVMKRTLTTGAIGVGAGLIAASWGGRFVQNYLFGVPSFDPLSYGMVTLAVLLVCSAAGYLPIRKLLLLQPASLLKAE